MGEARQSKALLKLGVASDLGTAIRTSTSGKSLASPETKKKNLQTVNKLLQDYKAYSNSNLDSKQLDRFLAEKIQKDIEAERQLPKRRVHFHPSINIADSIKKQQPSAGLSQSKQRTRSPVKQTKEGGIPASDTAGSARDKPGEVESARVVKNEEGSAPPTSRDGLNTGDPACEDVTLDVDADGRASGRSTATGTARSTATSRASTAPRPTSRAQSFKTAEQSSEIDIVQLEEDQEWNQSKPMVLNLEDLGESTIEVLEYESERPLEVEV